MGKVSDFKVGDEVVYIYKGASRIPFGEEGVVVGFGERGLWKNMVGVRYPAFENNFSDLNGLDATFASLWCDPNNIAHSLAGSEAGFMSDLEGFLE